MECGRLLLRIAVSSVSFVSFVRALYVQSNGNVHALADRNEENEHDKSMKYARVHANEINETNETNETEKSIGRNKKNCCVKTIDDTICFVLFISFISFIFIYIVNEINENERKKCVLLSLISSLLTINCSLLTVT